MLAIVSADRDDALRTDFDAPDLPFIAGLVEMDCLLCHTNISDHSARETALKGGDFAWANSASLSSLGILVKEDGLWVWDVSKFQANGALQAGLLDIRKAADENCSLCHGIAGNDLDYPLTIKVNTVSKNAKQKIEAAGGNVEVV